MSQSHTAFSGESAQGRRRLRVRGIVQGVGFRPFVYGLAHRLGLTGFVGNDSNGVFIEIEGPAPDLDAFEHTLATQAPPLAHVEELSVVDVEPRGDAAFVIVASRERAGARTLISPDLFTCADCLRELFDPADRRYLYPFINCTNCGPRFTIIKDIPYDRPRTTMSEFQMCDACAREYHDPADRRYRLPRLRATRLAGVAGQSGGTRDIRRSAGGGTASTGRRRHSSGQGSRGIPPGM
jgi:hydrogenase maturation protein HypF